MVFAGDGYDPTGTNGKMVHAIDLKTGKALWQLDTSTMVTDGRVAASPIALDLNADGYVDRVYVGTVGGDMLRLDVSAVGKSSSGGDVDPAGGVMVATCPAASPDCWSGGVLFSAGAAQPIFTKAAAAMDPMGNLWIFAGTGDRTDPLLMTSAPNLNRIYGIKDPYAGTPIAALTEADLTDVTNVNGGMGLLDPTSITNSGWFIALRPGEKEWAETALVLNQQVFFTTYMPGNIGCGDVGAGTIYMVYYLTGGGVTNTALFTATPPVASSRVYQVNAGATTRPALTTDLQLSKPVIYLANSSNLLLSPNFAAPTTARSTRYWRPIP